MSFQIIALKIGNSSEIADNRPIKYLRDSAVQYNSNYSRNLKKNSIYSFNKHYKFIKENDLTEFTYDDASDIPLYNIDFLGHTLPINISAIVGANGSGKSTLVELFYRAAYNIGCKLESYTFYKNPKEEEMEKMKIRKALHNLLPEEAKETISTELSGKFLYQPHPDLDLQILYRAGSQGNTPCFYKISFIPAPTHSKNPFDCNIQIHSYHKESTHYVCERQEAKKKMESLRQFAETYFYTMVVNYSLFSLNAKEVGNWVNPLFHKNDGYQTPIVLNPMRSDGNININSERSLLTRRLVSNILRPLNEITEERSLRHLANGKIARQIKMEYKADYLTDYWDRINRDDRQLSEEEVENLLNEVKENIPKVFNFTAEEIEPNFKKVMFLYITLKLIKMAYKYESLYGQFTNPKTKEIKDVKGLLTHIRDHYNHTNFKIKGAILHLKYYQSIYVTIGGIKKTPDAIFKDTVIMDIDQLSTEIESIRQKEEARFKVNTYMMAPPSIFKVEVEPERILQPDEDALTSLHISMDTFSSGEKQRINSLSSIVYHLINLNSVEENGQVVRYRYINIVLDEVELYYHPEWQRTFLHDLLDYIRKINFKDIERIEGINILIATHSPFILSDIPHTHILRLREGKEDTIEVDEKTFGANIYDLLQNDFFMKNGFIGDVAKEHIQSAIRHMQNESRSNDYPWTAKKMKSFINLIGEPLLRNSLFEIYETSPYIIDEKESIKEKIAYLQEQLNQFEK